MSTKISNVAEMLSSMGKTFKVLNTREREILRLRYGLEDGKQRTLEELAKMYSITKERVRQIEARAFEKINVILKYERE